MSPCTETSTFSLPPHLVIPGCFKSFTFVPKSDSEEGTFFWYLSLRHVRKTSFALPLGSLTLERAHASYFCVLHVGSDAGRE